MKSVRLLGILALLVFPGWASADPITIVSTSRGALALGRISDPSGSVRQLEEGSPTANPTVATASATTAQSVATATATVGTSGDPAHQSGTGALTAFVNTSAVGESIATAIGSDSVTFSLQQPYDFTFTGNFVGNDQPDNLNILTQWDVVLTRAGSGLPYVFHDLGTDTRTVMNVGELSPGDWTLNISDYANAFARVPAAYSANAQFTFNLDLTPAAGGSPTPEPASMLLLGSGIAGLVGARRKR